MKNLLILFSIGINFLAFSSSDSSFVEIVYHDSMELKKRNIDGVNTVYLDFRKTYMFISEHEYMSKNNIGSFQELCKSSPKIEDLLYFSSPREELDYKISRYKMDSILNHYFQLLENTYISNVDTLKIFGLSGEYDYSNFLNNNVKKISKYLLIHHEGILKLEKPKNLDFELDYLSLYSFLYKIDLKFFDSLRSENISFHSFFYCVDCVDFIGSTNNKGGVYIENLFEMNHYFINFFKNRKRNRFLKRHFPNATIIEHFPIVGQDYRSTIHKDGQHYKVPMYRRL